MQTRDESGKWPVDSTQSPGLCAAQRDTGPRVLHPLEIVPREDLAQGRHPLRQHGRIAPNRYRADAVDGAERAVAAARDEIGEGVEDKHPLIVRLVEEGAERGELAWQIGDQIFVAHNTVALGISLCPDAARRTDVRQLRISQPGCPSTAILACAQGLRPRAWIRARQGAWR